MWANKIKCKKYQSWLLGECCHFWAYLKFDQNTHGKLFGGRAWTLLQEFTGLIVKNQSFLSVCKSFTGRPFSNANYIEI